MSRRTFVAGSGTVLATILTGCADSTATKPTETPAYDHLTDTPVYIAPSVYLTLPIHIPTVPTPDAAALILLPADTETGVEQIVEWLSKGKVIALIGEEAEPTWLAWARSDPFADTFADNGIADGTPDPQLLVATTVDQHVSTYRHTWGHTPQDRDVLTKLDQDLADISDRTKE